jgi:hypothetical protein
MGGTTAGISGGPQETIRLMKALYDYMYDSGMRYSGDQGVPATLGDVRTIVQTVRMPRDVILTNQGLCVELALLWASVMEHLGVRTTVVFRPGHAFTLVWVGDGPSDFVPIETTAITPLAVGAKGRVPFEDAVKMAQQDLQNQKYQVWLNAQQYHTQGFRPPELPQIEIEKIKSILARRQVAGGGAGSGQVVRSTDPADDLPQGFVRWVGGNGTVAVGFPESWPRLENSPVPGMVFTAQDMQTSVAVNVFHFPKLRTNKEAMQTAQKGVAAVSGSKVSVASSQQKGDATVYSGSTKSSMGTTTWVGIFQPTSEGVVGVFIGAEQSQFERQKPMIETLIKYARTGAEQ